MKQNRLTMLENQAQMKVFNLVKCSEATVCNAKAYSEFKAGVKLVLKMHI